MNYEKIFWLLAIVVAVGFFAFLAFGAAVQPANAASARAEGSAYYAPYPGAGGAGTGAPSGAVAPQGPSAPTGGRPAQVVNGAQEVRLYVQGANYYPNPIRVKKGVPVRLVADIANMPGCSKSLVFPEFGIRKTVSAGDNVIEFTPQKSGTFAFSCSMNMYRGTMVVEEDDGSVAQYAGAALPSGSTCGGGGGGCGCGG